MVEPFARRVTGLLRELIVLFSTMQNKDWLTRQMTIIIEAICEEIEEDSTLFSGPAAAEWMVQFSKLMEWTATGDYSSLPSELVTIALKIDGRPEPPKQEPLFEYTSRQYVTPQYMGGRIELPRVELCLTLVILHRNRASVMACSVVRALARAHSRI